MIARAALALALLAAASPCAAQPCTARGAGFDLRDVRVDTGGRRPLALRIEGAEVDVVLAARAGRRERLDATIRASIELSATLDPSSVRHVLLPGHTLAGGMLEVRSLGAATVRSALADGRGGARVDLWIDGLGGLERVPAPCGSIGVVPLLPRGQPASAPTIEGAPYPRRDRIQLRAGPGDGETITWRPSSVSTRALEVIATEGAWHRARATLSDGSTLDAWIARRDLSSTARREPREGLGRLGTIAGSGTGYGCGRSHHDPSVTHAVLPRGTAIVDPATGRTWARAATDRSFEVHVVPGAARVEILDIPGVQVDGPGGCGPIAVVDASAIDLWVYDRSGLRLRADRTRDRFVVEAISGDAVALGLEAGDEIVALDGQRFGTQTELTAMATALLSRSRAVRVRRADREIDLPASAGVRAP